MLTKDEVIQKEEQPFPIYSLQTKYKRAIYTGSFSPFYSIIFSLCQSKFFLINMTTLSFISGVIGNIICVLFMLSPVPTFSRIVKHRSTEEFESLPYVSALATSSLWVFYGVMKSGGLLIATVNGFGIIIELVYVILYLIFAPPRMRAKTAILVVSLNVGFPAGVILVTLFTMDGDLRLDVLGFVCAVLNILMYASPFAAMKQVVTTKSVEYMPFLLSFFLLLNGAIWTFYAILVKDLFVGVPNGIGFILGASQIVLYAMYYKPKTSKNLSDQLEDEWQHKRLIHENSEE